jgi:hypothetical protein
MDLVIFVALVIAATLTREITGLVMLLSLWALAPLQRHWLLISGLCFAIVIIGLRLWLPNTNNPYTLSYVWSLNMAQWRMDNLKTLGGLLALVGLWFYQNPITHPLHRRLLIWVMLPYLLITFFFGVWQEVRLWMIIFLLGIPCLQERNHA